MPLLIQSYQARLALKAHQNDLLTRLTISIDSLKETQSKCFSVLPEPEQFKEDPKYRECHTLDAIVAASQNKEKEIPPFSVLRCAIEESVSQNRDVGTEALFCAIAAKLPWLNSEDGVQYQVSHIAFRLFADYMLIDCLERPLANPINKSAL
jgi:hypothetical protein